MTFGIIPMTILQETPGNAVCSPVGVFTLLSILQQGSRGHSREEINTALHAQPEETQEACRNITEGYNGYSERQLMLDFKNRAFIHSTFEVLPDFKQTLVDDFKSDIDLVDFLFPSNASAQINSWVAENTHNRINKLFEPDDLPDATRLAIVNVIYFKNYWLAPFYNTQNKNFSSEPQVQTLVPTLSMTAIFRGGEDSELGAKFVHMDFARTADFTVLLILPTERHGLDNLLNRLTADNLVNIFNHTGLKDVTLSVPKFRLNSDIDLVGKLQRLGVNDVFNDVANLTGIASLPLFVGKFIQKAEIALDEGGVTASAATGFTVQQRSGRGYPHVSETMEFIADHPFLFFIVDRVNFLPLFAGRVKSLSSS
ncbi:Serpin B9 [Blattella germanica]|nr:Serpin B9 [Blattella germanica]